MVAIFRNMVWTTTASLANFFHNAFRQRSAVTVEQCRQARFSRLVTHEITGWLDIELLAFVVADHRRLLSAGRRRSLQTITSVRRGRSRQGFALMWFALATAWAPGQSRASGCCFQTFRLSAGSFPR
jgi:hypothetical protein